jgi:hypothetical protein
MMLLCFICLIGAAWSGVALMERRCERAAWEEWRKYFAELERRAYVRD